MGIILDIILAAVVLIPFIIGLKRGLVGTVMGFISVVLALIISRVLAPYAEPLAQDMLVTPYIHEPLGEYVASELESGEGGAVSSVAAILEKLGIGELDAVYNGEEAASPSEAITAAAEARISEGIAFLGSFLIALIAMRIVTAIIEAVFRLPVLHGVNKVAGGALGALTGLGLGFALAWVLTVLRPTIVAFRPDLFGQALDNSYLLAFAARFF